MMPNMMQPGGMTPPVESKDPMMSQGARSPVKPDEGGADKDMIKQQLTGLLKQAQKVAQANGLDWDSIVAEISSNSVKSSLTPPRPPASPLAQTP